MRKIHIHSDEDEEWIITSSPLATPHNDEDEEWIITSSPLATPHNDGI